MCDILRLHPRSHIEGSTINLGITHGGACDYYVMIVPRMSRCWRPTRNNMRWVCSRTIDRCGLSAPSRQAWLEPVKYIQLDDVWSQQSTILVDNFAGVSYNRCRWFILSWDVTLDHQGPVSTILPRFRALVALHMLWLDYIVRRSTMRVRIWIWWVDEELNNYGVGLYLET